MLPTEAEPCVDGGKENETEKSEKGWKFLYMEIFYRVHHNFH